MKLPLFGLAQIGWLGIVCGFWPMTAPAQSTYEPYTFNTLAGQAGSRGSADETGNAARFAAPFGVAVDGVGNVYVADTGNATIRKIGPAGAVTTLAGLAGSTGSVDGTGSAARFYSPYGVAVDGAGNVYVADYGSHTIRKVTPTGVVTTLAGLAGGYDSVDGMGSAARFRCPSSVAVDSAGNVYVADTYNHTIRKITPGGMVSTLAGRAQQTGSADGTGSEARFGDYSPTGVAVDGGGNVYVADSYYNTIRKITPGGVVSTLAGWAQQTGSADGTGSTARFSLPNGVAADGGGNVYVADTLNNTIRKVTAAGVVTTLAGSANSSGIADGTGSAARFLRPRGVAVDSAGNVYVADTDNNTIRKGSPTPSGRPTITINPVSQYAVVGTNVTFSVVATGTTPLIYQWWFNSRTPILGQTNSTLTFNAVQTTNAGNYTVIVTNAAGSVTSLVAILMVLLPLDVAIQPWSPTTLRTNVGAAVTFTATTTGPGPLRYQWLFNGTPILGETNVALTLTHVQTAQSGLYAVAVRNPAETVTSPAASLTIVQLNQAEADLRAALRDGGNVKLESDGVITLNLPIPIDRDTVLDATGHAVVISGQNAVRVFTVSSNAHFTLINVTVANGYSDQGGGLYNDGGTVTLSNCIFTGNQAVGLDGTNGVSAYMTTPPAGSGVLYPNRPGGPGSMALGGAIFNRGECFATNCLFSSNRVVAGNGGSGGAGYSSYYWAMSVGAPGGPGGFGAGGGVYSLGTFSAANSTFCSNTVLGGMGGLGGSLSTSGTGGAAGDAAGGGLWSSHNSWLLNCTFYGNQTMGGSGGKGGFGGVSAVSGHPRVTGANGGNAGQGYGGAVCNSGGNLQVLSCTLSANNAFGGLGGAGDDANPPAQPGADGRGFGGNLDNASGSVSLELTILANSSSGSDAFGALTDMGYNICSDASCHWTASTSLSSTDPRLGPLIDNGGPTPTLALLSGSPAIDAGHPPNSPPIDQRGVARPVGKDCDVGAFEGSVALPAVDLTVLPSIISQNGTATLTLTLANPNAGLPLDNVYCVLRLPAELNLVRNPYGFSPEGSVQVIPLLDHTNITVSNLTLLASQAWTAKVDVAGSVLGRPTAVAVAGARITGPSTAVASAALSVTGPPKVGLEAAQVSGLNTATVYASVTPNGLQTTVWFEYGTTIDYANRTPMQDLGSGYDPLFVTAGLSDLATNATCHFRVVATNSSSLVQGEDQTLSPPRTLMIAEETSLRSALSVGGAVKLACDGTMLLTSPLAITRDTTLDASGHDLTLSGNNATRVLHVYPGIKLTLIHLTIADGKMEKGAGLLNDGGVVNILDCTFVNNHAVGRDGTNGATYPKASSDGQPGGPAHGGGIYNYGMLLAKNTRFLNNGAAGGKGGRGGNAETNASSTSVPGQGGGGGGAYGGGIYQQSGRLILESCVGLSNCVNGGDGNLRGALNPMFSTYGLTTRAGPAGGDAFGGWVYSQQGQVQLNDCTASQNSAVGGKGGESVVGDGIVFTGGDGGAGGNAGGGALCNVGLAAVNWSAFASNQVLGGLGGPGCQSPGTDMSRSSNPGIGGVGGWAQGAAIMNQGALALNHGRFIANEARGGAGGVGGPGRNYAGPYYSVGPPAAGGAGGAAAGGGVANENGSIEANDCAFSNDLALGGVGGPGGIGGVKQDQRAPNGTGGLSGGGSIANDSGYMILWNSIVAGNPTGPGASGLITDGGHNLGWDASCGFTTLISQNKVGDNAINSVLQTIRLDLPQRMPNGQFGMTLAANANQTYVLQVSTNLASWLDWTNVSPASLNTLIIDPEAQKYDQRFYRAIKR